MLSRPRPRSSSDSYLTSSSGQRNRNGNGGSGSRRDNERDRDGRERDIDRRDRDRGRQFDYQQHRNRSSKKALLLVGKTVDQTMEHLKSLAEEAFDVMITTEEMVALRMVNPLSENLAAVVIVLTVGHEGIELERWKPLAQSIRSQSRRTFLAVYSILSAVSAPFRAHVFLPQSLCANMATACPRELAMVLGRIESQGQGREAGPYRCPYCKMEGLSEDGLHTHFPLYHVSEPNITVRCPICATTCEPRSNPFSPHLYNKHGPPSRNGEGQAEDAEGPSLYAYALVVCQNDQGRFLLVQEFSNSGFWLPGGRVDAGNPVDSDKGCLSFDDITHSGEDFVKAAIRETEEEAGIAVELTGVLRVEFTPSKEVSRSPYCRMRVIFTARPKDPNQLPKGVPDYESVGAAWASAEEVEHQLPLRGIEPKTWIPYVARGGAIYPLSLLTREGAPYLRACR